MRAIAALMVVISHSAIKGEQYSTDPLYWFNVGGVGVDLFFIISGFIMCYTANNKKINVTTFIKLRLRRIIPIYWLLTTFALVIYVLFPEKVNSSGGHTNILYSYLLFPSDDKFLIQNGWTLSFEFLFYFIFSFCLLLGAKFRFLVPVGIILSLVFLGRLISSDSAQILFITRPLLLEFAFGIFAYYLYNKITSYSWFGLILIVFSVIWLLWVNQLTGTSSRVLEFGIPALTFFIGMLSFESLFRKHSDNVILKVAKAIGDSSYSLYLFHTFSLVIFAILFKKIGITEYGYIFVLLLVISSIIAGHFCYLFLEKPMDKLFFGYKSKRAISHA